MSGDSLAGDSVGLPSNYKLEKPTRPTIWSLCCISLLLPWAATTLGSQKSQPVLDHTRRRELLESALNKWSFAVNNKAPKPTLMLFHLVSLSIHVKVANLKHIVHQYIDPEHSNHSQSTKSSQSRVHLGPKSSSLDVFQSDMSRVNALWHAGYIIRLALEHNEANSEDLIRGEFPHFSYCVFFAALTFWYAGTQQTPENTESTCQQGHVPNAAISKAIEVLSVSPVQVAYGFSCTLRSLIDLSPEG